LIESSRNPTALASTPVSLIYQGFTFSPAINPAGHLKTVEMECVIRVTQNILEWQLQNWRAEEKNPQFPLLLFSKPVLIGRRKCLKGHLVRGG